jgi:O-succinylbenzoate synthase
VTAPPVAVELRRVGLDLRHPLVAGHATIARREVVLVAVRMADGATGWGECAALERPTYSPETTAGAWALLRDELAPAALAGRPDGVAGHPMAHAALADACLDARLRASGTGLAASLGASRAQVPSVRVLGIAASVDELLAAVEAAPAGVKLKIAPGWDVEPLRAVRAAFPDRWLAADANGGYDPDGLEGLASIDELDLAYLEQPVAGLTAAAEASKRLATPVVLDEPIGAADTVRAALALGGLGGVNLKPGKAGGIEATARVIALAADEGLAAFVGGMLETGVGRAGALALAALDGCTLPTDLGPSEWYFDTDVTPPVVAGRPGTVAVPSGPGLGVEPDPVRLDAATTDRVVLEA